MPTEDEMRMYLLLAGVWEQDISGGFELWWHENDSLWPYELDEAYRIAIGDDTLTPPPFCH
jgi:hypothetical protein